MGEALAAQGAPPAVIQAALGHANIVSTLRYISGRDDAAVRAAVLAVTDRPREADSGSGERSGARASS